MEVLECNLLQFNLMRMCARRRRRVVPIAAMHFPEHTLLDDFMEAKAVQKFHLTKELIFLLYVRLCVVLEATTQQSHAILGMTNLLNQMIAGNVVGMS